MKEEIYLQRLREIGYNSEGRPTFKLELLNQLQEIIKNKQFTSIDWKGNILEVNCSCCDEMNCNLLVTRICDKGQRQIYKTNIPVYYAINHVKALS